MKAFQLMLLNMMLLVILLKRRQQRLQRRVPQMLCTSSLTERLYMRELLEGSPSVVYSLVRMDTNAFVHLCDHFREMGYLYDSKHLDVEEKMMIFLQIISQSMGNRLVRHRFQHSAETISKYFHEVLLAVLEFSKEILVVPSWEAPVPVEQIRNYSKLRKGPFKGVVGALDDTLIHAVVPLDRQTLFRGRGGGECYQNVLAICDFDMKFIYVVSGWEGVAHDSRILSESVRNPAFNFPMPPPDKYYLCDAAYTHTKGFMTPYRNTRYLL